MGKGQGVKLIAYTDGACSGNPGPGGWGVLLQAFRGDALIKERELSGFEPMTTNNRMELRAAIGALEALERASTITIITDSVYLRDGITKWIDNWKAKNWRTASKKPVKNSELWQRLDDLAAGHQIDWQWVKGHAGEEGNERADKLATGAIAAARKQSGAQNGDDHPGRAQKQGE